MLFSNYRPISLLSSISKIYEIVIFHQLLNYIDTNELFYNDQYGFRPRHSIELVAVRFVTDLIKNMDNYKIPTTVLTLSGPGYLMSLKVRGGGGHMCPPSNLEKY